MPRTLAPILLLLLGSLLLPTMTGARPLPVDPADYLPSGVSVLRTMTGDVDGDGTSDLVVLYALPATLPAPAHAGLLVLRDVDGAATPAHLFGEPPASLRGEPVLDPRGTVDLALRDLTGDARPEIVLTVRNQFQEPTPRTLLWVFGRGDVPATEPVNPHAPATEPWAGTGFRLEVFLEGGRVEIEDGPAGGPAALRRQAASDRLRGPEPTLVTDDAYTWRSDGFRLGSRALTLPAASAGSARSAETAVLSFYVALGAGDLQRAMEYLDDDLRASRSALLANDPTAPSRAMRVEEIRTLDSYADDSVSAQVERLVSVRVSLADPQPDAPDQRITDAGIWRVRKVGDAWRLAQGTLHRTPNLPDIADALPPGVALVETDSADVRGLGVADLAVVAAPPGRYALMEPYLIWQSPDGSGRLEPAVPLARYAGEPSAASVDGSVRIDDVNRDGIPDVAYSAVVGAHSTLFWLFQWDGATLAPLFTGVSSVPAGGVADVDGDGTLEILEVHSGYCGSYAASPVMPFVFRWQDGAYRPASRDYPRLYDGAVGRALEMTAGPPPTDAYERTAWACAQHLLATALAFRGHASEMRVAYRAYGDMRRSLGGDEPGPTRPSYLGLPYVEENLRAVLTAAADNPAAWGAPERAVLHDLLGDALMEQARIAQYEADGALERGDDQGMRAARLRASLARQAATHEYEAARSLDPDDQDARRTLGE